MTDPKLFASLPTAGFLTARRQEAPNADLIARFTADVRLSPGARTKPVVVLDTNVLLDVFYWDDPAARLLKAALAEHRFWAARTDDTTDEFADVLRRPRFALTIKAQCDILRRWHEASVGVTLSDAAPAVFCRDPDDVKFLKLAKCLAADLLVTKDKKVLKAGRKLRSLGTAVLTPSDLAQPALERFAFLFSALH